MPDFSAKKRNEHRERGQALFEAGRERGHQTQNVAIFSIGADLNTKHRKLRYTRPRLQTGQVALGAVLLFLFISSTIVFGMARAVYHQMKISLDLGLSRSSYYLSEALVEDLVYRYIKGIPPIVNTVSLSLGGQTAWATVSDIPGGKQILSEGDWNDSIRKIRTRITYGSGGSFFYGVQVGEGGLWMENTSSIGGNVASSGSINGTGNMIYGDAISAGSSGLINDVHATSSAYAHTIKDSTVDRDAYFVTLTNTSVGGTQHPNSPDQATSSLPISDSQIEQWKADAFSGGEVTCTDGKYIISNNVTIGPKKIPCDFEISGNPTITLNGALWIEGNLETKNTPTVRVSSALSNVTVPVVVDNPDDRINSSKIDFNNSSTFQGGGGNSYILFVSQNKSAEDGGAIDAIKAGNSLTGEVLLYAPHGNITLQNTVNLREVTAYKLTTKNSSKVEYKSGLASIVFSSGPSGGFEVLDWRETQ